MKTKTTTTTREYDAKGRMTSEVITVTEYEWAPVWVNPVPTVYPGYTWPAVYSVGANTATLELAPSAPNTVHVSV